MSCRAWLLMVVLAGPVSYGQAAKQPWTLTLEERIALRTDPELARERIRGSGRVRTTAMSSGAADAFDGKSHPELFLPHQVFRTLIDHAFLVPDGTGIEFRRGVAPDLSIHGLPGDFWQRLENVSRDYIRDTAEMNARIVDLRELKGRARRDAQEALEDKKIESCRSRARALTDARREFGVEHFDRFLYEVIATNMFHVTDELPRAGELRRAEEGCR